MRRARFVLGAAAAVAFVTVTLLGLLAIWDGAMPPSGIADLPPYNPPCAEIDDDDFCWSRCDCYWEISAPPGEGSGSGSASSGCVDSDDDDHHNDSHRCHESGRATIVALSVLSGVCGLLCICGLCVTAWRVFRGD